MTTVDHKRLGIMYLVGVLSAFLVGGIFALLIRLSLLTPSHTLFGKQLLTAEAYNKVFTLHGVIMVFLFIIPRCRRRWGISACR
jgi:cytochrome c oxidase subunit 1